MLMEKKWSEVFLNVMVKNNQTGTLDSKVYKKDAITKQYCKALLIPKQEKEFLKGF